MEKNLEMTPIRIKIGPYEICPLSTGEFGLDGGAMFGTVPKVLWQRSNPADEQNRIKMEARALLLKSDQMNVIIDTGNGGDFIPKYGPKLGPKFSEMYNVNANGPSLLKSLNANGISPEDVGAVILTHLHFDHAGGGTCERNGKIVPTFPKARYFLQEKNLETARKPNVREKASYFSANFQPLLDAKVLTLLENSIPGGPIVEGGWRNILPNIFVRVTNGHTLGQQIVKISDEKCSLIYCADLIPTSSHVRTAWIMGYDLDPLQIISEKQQLLKEAAAENSFLFFEHDPYTHCAQVSAVNEDFVVTQRFQIDPSLSP